MARSTGRFRMPQSRDTLQLTHERRFCYENRDFGRLLVQQKKLKKVKGKTKLRALLGTDIDLLPPPID